MYILRYFLSFLIFIFLFVYISDTYYDTKIQQKIKYYYDETLYYFKIKERPKEEPFVGMIKSIVKVVSMIPKLVLNIDKIFMFLIGTAVGVTEMIGGASTAVALGFHSLGRGIAQFGVFLIYSLEFLITHLFCFLKIIFEAPSCVFWYIIETIGKIFYLIPTALFALVGIFSFGYIDGFEIEKLLWQGLETLDTISINNAGFHIIHYPKWIRDRCYNCKRLKMNVVGKQFSRSMKSITKHFPNDAKPGITLLKGGGRRFAKSFKTFGEILG